MAKRCTPPAWRRALARHGLRNAWLVLMVLSLGFAAPALSGENEDDKVSFLSSKLTDDSSFKVRLKAAVLLGRLADPRAVRPLVSALRDDNYVVRGAAARALGNLGVPVAMGSIEPLFRLVDDQEPFVQAEAKRALKRMAKARSLDYFISALSSPRAAIRLAAVHIISGLDLAEARSALIIGLGDEDDEVRAETEVAVRGMGQADLEALLRQGLARGDSYMIQSSAARLAGEMKMVSLMGPLADLLVSDAVVPEVKKEAAASLAEMKSSLDVAGLAEQLQAEDKEVQYRAIQLLGIHGGRGAVDALMGVLRHPDNYMRRRAVFALGDAGDPRAIPALEFLLNSEEEPRFKKVIERVLRRLRP